MEKNGILSFLEENQTLQHTIKDRLDGLRRQIVELEHFDEMLNLYYQKIRKTLASRAPLDRSALIKCTPNTEESGSASSGGAKFSMQKDRKRNIHMLSSDNISDKKRKPEFYLNRYVPTVAYNVKLEDPFIDAGLCGSPGVIRVILKPYPLSNEATKVRHIMSKYNVSKVKAKPLDITSVKVNQFLLENPCEESSRGHTTFHLNDDEIEPSFPEAFHYNFSHDKKSAIRFFKNFLLSEKAKQIIEEYWEDKYALQEHLKREYTHLLAIEIDLWRETGNPSNHESQLISLVEAPTSVILEYFINPIRSLKISCCSPSTLFCSESVFFIKRLQSEKYLTHSKISDESLVLRKVIKEIIKRSDAFPKTRLIEVFAALKL